MRVLERTYSDFQAWKVANSSFDNSPFSGPDMRDCYLTLSTADDRTGYCPVPYNDKVPAVIEGERLTLRLPPSPCDPNCSAAPRLLLARMSRLAVHRFRYITVCACHILGIGAGNIGALAALYLSDLAAHRSYPIGGGIPHHTGRYGLGHYIAPEEFGAAADQAAIDFDLSFFAAGHRAFCLCHLDIADAFYFFK